MAGHTMCGLDEDLDRGRIYMPQDDLRLDVDLERRAVTTEWRAFLAYEIEGNRALYLERQPRATARVASLPG
jgi:phytoene synthase